MLIKIVTVILIEIENNKVMPFDLVYIIKIEGLNKFIICICR